MQQDKIEYRKKMSVIATTIEDDEELTLSKKLWDEIRQKGFE